MLTAIGEEHLEEDAMALWHAALSSGLSTCPGLLELFGRLVQLLEAGPDNLEVFMPLPGWSVSFYLSISAVVLSSTATTDAPGMPDVFCSLQLSVSVWPCLYL